MSGFKTLRDVSIGFEEDLRAISNQLFSAKVDEPFETIISKKLNDVSLYTSKLRLLQAKSIAASQPSQTDEQATITNYSNTVKWKIVEQQVVKSTMQSHCVKNLLTTPDSRLSPDMVERKEKIYEQLMKYKDKETELRHLDTVLRERQQHLEEVRGEWDTQLGLLRQRRNDVSENEDDDVNPLSNKLHSLEVKIAALRTLLARLASARGGGYDWLADPHNRLRSLQLARQ